MEYIYVEGDYDFIFDSEKSYLRAKLEYLNKDTNLSFCFFLILNYSDYDCRIRGNYRSSSNIPLENIQYTTTSDSSTIPDYDYRIRGNYRSSSSIPLENIQYTTTSDSSAIPDADIFYLDKYGIKYQYIKMPLYCPPNSILFPSSPDKDEIKEEKPFNRFEHLDL